MQLNAYRLALDAVRRAAELAISRLVFSLYDRTDRAGSVERLSPAVTEVVRAHRAEAYRLAVEMIETQAGAQGVDAPYIPSQSGYAEASARTVLREDLRGSPDEVVSIIAPKLGQHVEDSARQTVIRTVEDGREPESATEREHRSRDALSPAEFERLMARREEQYRQVRGIGNARLPIRSQRSQSWARMLTGAENCGFCVMLASRGPVYESATAAGRQRASDLYDTKVTSFVNDYHTNCDCLVVPIYEFVDWAGHDQVKKLREFYKEAIENADWDRISSDNPNLAAVEQALRRMRKEGKHLPVEDLRGSINDSQYQAA